MTSPQARRNVLCRILGVLCLWTIVPALPSAAVLRPGIVDAAPQASAPQPSIQERLKRIGSDVFTRPDRAKDSIRELKEILAEDPSIADAHVLLGLAYRSEGLPEMMGEAVAEFRQALALNPTLAPARLYLAQVYLDLGRTARAREELETALAQAPNNATLLAVLGETERQAKNPKLAVEVLRRALQSDPSFAQARYYLALALFDLGQRDEAIKTLEEVVRAGAEVPDVYASLGAGYLEAGRSDEAIQALTRGTLLDPARRDMRILLARAFRTKGLLAKAAEQLALATPDTASTLASQQIEFDYYMELGLLRQKQKQLDAAADALIKVLDRDPDHGPAHRALAEVYLAQAKYAQALQHATRAADLGAPLSPAQLKVLKQKVPGKHQGARP